MDARVTSVSTASDSACDVAVSGERYGAPLSSGEQALRAGLVFAFLGLLATEAWLLWHAWILWG